MIQTMLVYFGVKEETAENVHFLLNFLLALVVVGGGLLGNKLSPNIHWESLIIAFSAALIVFAVDAMYSGLRKLDKLQQLTSSAFKDIVRSDGRRVDLLTGQEYVNVAAALFRGHKGDLAFFNVHLKMFLKEDIFKKFWPEGLLLNQNLSKIVILHSVEEDVLSEAIGLANKKNRRFLNWCKDGKVILKALREAPQLPNFENVGGLIFSSRTSEGMRKVDYAFILIRNELFPDETLYRGFFLFFSTLVGQVDASLQPVVTRIEEWAESIHDHFNK